MFSSAEPHFLALVTLLDQVDPKGYNWQQVLVILRGRLPPAELFDLLKSNKELPLTFLMDRKRAGSFWVNSQKYADLAAVLLKFLRDK